MRVVFAGTPEVALPSLDAMASSDHELVGVVTRPDAPAGPRAAAAAVARSPGAPRSSASRSSSPTTRATPAFQAALRALAPDCCPVVAYGALLPQSALDIPPHGWVNLHFSCLPAWRGAAPVQHAIWAGDEVTGATTFRIVRDARRRADVRRDDRAGPPRRHRRRPARPARRGRRRAARGDARRSRGRRRWRLVAQPEEGLCLAPKIDRRGRPRRLERACGGGRPAGPRLHPGPGRVDHPRGRAAQAGPGARGPGRPGRSAGPAPGLAPGRSPSASTTCSSAPPPGRCGWVRSRRSASGRCRRADWARGVRIQTGARLGGDRAN